MVDGGGVKAETPGEPLSREQVLENLGVFAQLPAEIGPFIEELLVPYLLTNSEHALPLEALLKQVHKIRNWRLNDFLKKVARDCSLFSARIGPFGAQVVRRDEAAALHSLLADPTLASPRAGFSKPVVQLQLRNANWTAGPAYQALQHQGSAALVEALLAAEPRLAQLGRG